MTPLHLALALLIAVIWGFTFITAKIGVSHFPPIFFTALRFGLVAIVLVPWLKVIPGRMRDVLVIALLAGAVHFGLMYSGMAMSSTVSAVAVLVQLGAPFSVLIAVVWLKEAVTWPRIVGIALSFIGVMVLGFDPNVLSNPLAAALVVGGAFVMSFAMILMRRLRDVGVFELQAWIAAVSAPLLFAGSFAFESSQFVEFADPSWLPIGAVLFTALATSIVGHGGWYYLLQRYSVSQVTGFGLLPPILTVVFGVLIFGEPMTWKLVLSVLLVTIGIAIITLWRDSAKPAAAAVAKLPPLAVKEVARAAE